jgi:hypothetical protein
MENAVDAVQRTPDKVSVAQIARQKLDIGGRLAGLAMNLWDEAVENPDLMSRDEQFVAEMAPDESRPTRDQISRCHSSLRLWSCRRTNNSLVGRFLKMLKSKM